VDAEDVAELVKGLSLGQRTTAKKGCSPGHIKLWRDEQAEKCVKEEQAEEAVKIDPLCGFYRTVETYIEVCESKELDSRGLHEIGKDIQVEVVETVAMPEISRVRGRLSTGGWISLLDTSDQGRWVMPMPKPGLYRTVPKVLVASGSDRSSRQIETLGSDVVINVVETTLVGDRVRAKLDSGGWISLINTSSGRVCAVPMPDPGPYRVRNNAPSLYETSAQGSSFRNSISPHELVHVEEVRLVKDQVRGRLQRGGWISILQTTNKPPDDKPLACKPDGGWARPLCAPGLYYITSETRFTQDSSKDSPEIGTATEGSILELTEIKLLSGEQRIRGLSSQGWVSIFDTHNETGFAKSVRDCGFWSTDRR